MKRIRRRLPERLDVPEVRVLVEEATKHFESERFDKAEVALAKAETRLAEVHKGRQRVWWERDIELWRARLTYGRGDHERAAAMFTRLLKELPEDDVRYLPCLNWLGHSDWFCGRYDAAFKAISRVADNAPYADARSKARAELPKIRHHRAIANAKEGRIAEALKEVKALLAEEHSEPLQSELRLILGKIYAHPEVKRYREASEILKSVLDSASEAKTREQARDGWQVTRSWLAGLEVDAGNYDAARKEFDALLAEGVQGKGLHSCLVAKAHVLIKTRRYREAEQCYVEVLRAYGVDPETRAKATEYLDRLRREHL